MGRARHDRSEINTAHTPDRDPRSRQRLRLELPARPESLEQSRAALRTWLRDLGASPKEVGEIVAACGEACLNAVVHAYTVTPGAFELDAGYRDGEVGITVRDRGRWRAPRGGNGGHGFAIMRAMSDSVVRHSGAHGTEVQLRRRLRHPARDEAVGRDQPRR